MFEPRKRGMLLMATTRMKSKSVTPFRPVPAAKIPAVVPPRSVVILATVDPRKSPDWKADRGRMFRIGYYSPKDGLDCIWLVNDAGEYEQTTDRVSLLQHFVILHLSNEKDLYGTKRPALKPLNIKQKPASAIPAMLAS